MNRFANKLSAIVLSAAMLLPFSAASGAVFRGGVDCYYHTEVRTYMFGAPITAYNRGGYTLIDAEILNWHYGFEVVWDGEARTLSITDLGTDFVSEQAKSGELCVLSSGTPGTLAGNNYVTDIVTYFNGRRIDAYNTGGRTLIPAEELIHFGYNVIWNGEDMSLRIERPDDMYTIDTEIGTLTSATAFPKAGETVLIERGLCVTDDGGTDHILEMPSGQLMAAAVGHASFVRLSDIVSLLGGELMFVGNDARINLTEKTPPYNYLPYSESALVPKSEKKCDEIPVISGLGLKVTRVPDGDKSWSLYSRVNDNDDDILVYGGELWISAMDGARLLGFVSGK